MKTVKNICAQGDVILRRVDTVPDNFIPAKSVNGKYEVAHSETGHSHTVLEKQAQLFIDETNDFIAYLRVNESGALLEHERSFDTHETIKLPPGVYKIHRQREYIPEGYRRAQD